MHLNIERPKGFTRALALYTAEGPYTQLAAFHGAPAPTCSTSVSSWVPRGVQDFGEMLGR